MTSPDLDTLLRASAPLNVTEGASVGADLTELVDAVLESAPRRRRFRRGALIAAIVAALTLGAGAATAADAIWPAFLGGPPDANVAVTVLHPGQAAQTCEISVVVKPTGDATTHSADYLAAKRFLQTHNWSHLRPKPSLMLPSAAEAKAHHIDVRPLLAGTVAAQITDAVTHAGLLSGDLELKGIAACRHARTLPADPEQARMWLFVTARNTLRNHDRGHRRRHALAHKLADALRVHATVEADDRADDVRDAVAALNPVDRELVRLIYWDGFPIVEAAELLEIPASTARGRLQSIRSQLRDTLAEPATTALDPA